MNHKLSKSALAAQSSLALLAIGHSGEAKAELCPSSEIATCSITNYEDIDNDPIEIDTTNAIVTIENHGAITEAPQSQNALYTDGHALVSVTNRTFASSTINVVNAPIVSGAIRSSFYAGSGLAVGAVSEISSANVNILNQGEIIISGGSLFRQIPDATPYPGPPGLSYTVVASAALAVGVLGNGSRITIENGQGATIGASGALRLANAIAFSPNLNRWVSVEPPLGNFVIPNSPADYGTVAIAVYGQDVTIENFGVINGSAGSVIPAGVTLTAPDLDISEFEAALNFPDSFLAGAIHSFGVGRDRVINDEGAAINGSIYLGGGSDHIGNFGTINGNVRLGSGDDSFDMGIRAGQFGLVDGGLGNDSVSINLSNGRIDAGGGSDEADVVFNAAWYSQFINFENFGISGRGTVLFSDPVPFETLMLSGNLHIREGSTLQTAGPNAITAVGISNLSIAGTVNGNINMGAGNDVLTLASSGVVNGSVNLNSGDDIVALSEGSTLAGMLDGGEGTDRIAIQSAGTASQPYSVDDLDYINFEEMETFTDYGVYAGNLEFQRFWISRGRLAGLSGSTLNAPNINVAAGATFGSAGTVNGNINVSGTLAPGASPGTMAVVGNVALASGSTTVFELSDTVNDQLLISGTLAIASGTNLTLTGSRALTPGSTLDLIVAEGGITGSFSAINQPSTIGGFIAQRGNRVQLLGQFATSASFAPHISDTVDYVNTVLIAGQANTALLDTLPLLLTSNGGTNEAAFAQLSPEAYASASQISLESGLAISKALRSINRQQAKPGLFIFAEAFANWRRFGANAVTGTSRANVRGAGALGGIGVGGENGTIAAFVGYSNSRQSISTIGSKTVADGVFVGLTAGLSSGGLQANVSLGFDNRNADTTRILPGNATTGDHYDLKGLMLDASLRYSMPVSANWAVAPELALTHVNAKRGAVSETGSAAFDLAVQNRKASATFVEAGLTLAGGQEARAKMAPWLSIGLQHRLGGDEMAAIGGFKSAVATYTIAGADRRDTLVTLGAGVEMHITERLTINAAYRGEFGKANAGSNITVGLKLAL